MRAACRTVIERLTLVRSIALEAGWRPNEERVWLRGLCGGPAAHELFLADSSNYAMRAFDVRAGRLDARDVYTATWTRVCMWEYVNDVVYTTAPSRTRCLSPRNTWTRQRALVGAPQRSIVRLPPHAIQHTGRGRMDIPRRSARRESSLQSVWHWRRSRVPRAPLPLAAALRQRHTL